MTTNLPYYWRGTYQQVVAVLGEPTAPSDDQKTHVEWQPQTPHGAAEVYDYVPIHTCEPGCEWDPRDELPVRWHINSPASPDAAQWVRDHLETTYPNPCASCGTEVDLSQLHITITRRLEREVNGAVTVVDATVLDYFHEACAPEDQS